MKVSENADRAILFFYIAERGVPKRFRGGEDGVASQLNAFMTLTGLSQFDALAAFAEAEDADMIERNG